ncbi:MAG: hypothetical protein LBJ03_01680 [Holosporales bacterium]|nr:hypothetical protein [Holosporales bacterium]
MLGDYVGEQQVQTLELSVHLKRSPDSIKGDVGTVYPNPPKKSTIIVYNIPYDVTEEQFATLCSGYGGMLSTKILKKSTGESRGFGFVEFDSPETAERAITSLNSACCNNRQLRAEFAKPKDENRPPSRGRPRDDSFGRYGYDDGNRPPNRIRFGDDLFGRDDYYRGDDRRDDYWRR